MPTGAGIADIVPAVEIVVIRVLYDEAAELGAALVVQDQRKRQPAPVRRLFRRRMDG